MRGEGMFAPEDPVGDAAERKRKEIASLRTEAKSIVDDLIAKDADFRLGQLDAFLDVDRTQTYGAARWEEIKKYANLRYAEELLRTAEDKISNNLDIPGALRCFAGAVEYGNKAGVEVGLPLINIENLISDAYVTVAQRRSTDFPPAD